MHKSKFTQVFAKYYNAGKTEAFFLMEKKFWQVILRKKAFIWHKYKIDYHTTSTKQIIPVNYCIYSGHLNSSWKMWGLVLSLALVSRGSPRKIR